MTTYVRPLNLDVGLLGLMSLVQHFIYQMRINMSKRVEPAVVDSQHNEVPQPLQDSPHLQTPTRGTQRHHDAPHLQTPTRGGQTPTGGTQRRQDAPHLQTPTRGGQTPTGGTQRRQPLQDASHLQTRTGGTQCHQDGQISTGGIQRHQALQDDNMPSRYQDTVLNKPTNSHSAYLYAPYTPVAVRVAKRIY